MPGYKAHITTALVFYIIIFFVFSLYVMPVTKLAQWLLALCAGALFPDIDIKSKGQKYFYMLLSIIIIGAIIYNKLSLALFLALASCAPLLVRHRGLFHKFWFLVLLVIICSELLVRLLPGYSQEIASNSLFFLVGIISHLWADKNCTKLLRF